MIVSSSKKPHYIVLLNNKKNCVLESSEKFIIYNTFLNVTICIKTKKRKQKCTLYITTCFNIISCIKIENGKQICNTRLYDRNIKKIVKTVHRLKKNQQSKSKFFTFIFDGIYCVSQFLSFYYLLFAFIHKTFYFNGRSMSFC